MYPTHRTVQKRRRTIRLRALISVAAVITVLLVLILAIRYFGIDFTPASNLKPVGFQSGSQYVFTGTGFLYMNGSELVYQDLGRGKNWTKPLASADIKLAASSSISVVYNSIAMQPLGKEGAPLFDAVDLRGAVLSIKCGNSRIAILKLDEAGTPLIYVYDSRGVKLDSIPFESRSVVDFGFYGAEDYLWVQDIDTSGVSLMTSMSIYSPDQSLSAHVVIEGQAIERLYFVEKSIYAVGTSHLLSYDFTGKELARRLIYGWKVQDYALISGKPHFLITPRPSVTGSVTGLAKLIALDDSVKDVLITLPENAIGEWIFGESIVVATASSLSYFTFKGELKNTVTLDAPITDAEKINEKYLLATRGTEMLLATVK